MANLLKPEELADMLGINLRTLNRRRANGKLGIAEINIAPDGEQRRQPRFKIEDVETFLSQRTVQS